MDDDRRRRFIAWFDAKYAGDRARFIADTGKAGEAPFTKGRVTQLFDPEQPFGERAARNLAHRLKLAEDFFLTDRPEGLPAATSDAPKRAVPTRNVEPAPSGTRRVPILSYVQAGNPTETVAELEDAEYLLTHLDLSEGSFALRIKGDSMRPDFDTGDVVIIDPTVRPLPGDFVVARNGSDEACFKKYRPRGTNEAGRQIFELVPLNPDYASIRSDITPVTIVGTMVEHRKYRRRKI